MHNKILILKCKTCGKKFESDTFFERGKLECYVDCPTCRKSKDRYLTSVDIYQTLYKKEDKGED